MQSMTGYGKETSRQGDWEMTVELRAVNHRFQKIYYTTSRCTLQVVSRICTTSAFSHCNLDTQSARCYTLEHPRMFFLCFSPICHAQGGCSP